MASSSIAIQSKDYRSAAKNNGLRYLGLHIYVGTSIPKLTEYRFPTYALSSSDGALAKLMSTLVNIESQIQAVQQGQALKEAKQVPGVIFEAAKGLELSIGGTVYNSSASDYAANRAAISGIVKACGWTVGNSESSVVAARIYSPTQSGLYNNNPVEQGLKGMLTQAVSDVQDGATMVANKGEWHLTGNSSADAAGTQAYAEAAARSQGSSIFKSAAISYFGNLPTTTQNNWGALSAQSEYVPELYVAGTKVWSASVGFMPSSLTVEPGAYVRDNTGFYPTELSVDVQMDNPLGSLISSSVNGKPGQESAGLPAVQVQLTEK